MKCRIVGFVICLAFMFGCNANVGNPNEQDYETTKETYTVLRGDTFSCALERCGGCAYQWHYTSTFSDIIEFIGYGEFAADPDTVMIGQPVIQEWKFTGKEAGQSRAAFDYRELNNPKVRRHILTVTVK